MAAILNFSSRTMSGNVRGDVVKSGMVDNMVIAVGIATPSLVVQKLFHFQLLAAILNLENVINSLDPSVKTHQVTLYMTLIYF